MHFDDIEQYKVQVSFAFIFKVQLPKGLSKWLGIIANKLDLPEGTQSLVIVTATCFHLTTFNGHAGKTVINGRE